MTSQNNDLLSKMQSEAELIHLAKEDASALDNGQVYT